VHIRLLDRQRHASRRNPAHTGNASRPRRRTGPSAIALALLALLFALPGFGQIEEKFIGPLSALDRQYMDQQRQRIRELTLRHYGGQCCRREAELDYLQRLLDDRHVTADQRELLQAMGILLGDLLAEELDLDWVIYEDARGRSRALQIDESDNFVFPVTMISRRWEVGDRKPVSAIYGDAVEAIKIARPPLPFQE
jgi:hypothetical protein